MILIFLSRMKIKLFGAIDYAMRSPRNKFWKITGAERLLLQKRHDLI